MSLISECRRGVSGGNVTMRAPDYFLSGLEPRD
jgi:hypothetical protein